MKEIQKRLFVLALILLTIFYLKTNSLLKTTTIKNYALNLSTKPDFENETFPKFSEPPFVLSYSFFGNNLNGYINCIERVAVSANRSNFYKNWSVRLYHEGRALNENLVKSLQKKYTNLFLYNVNFLPDYGNVSYINGMSWRFLPAGDSTVQVVCSRDLDSPLLEREEDAVREWLNSDKIFHIMRDNPVHGVVILGGTWCFKNKNSSSLGKTIAKLVIEKSKRRNVTKEAPKGDDQDVLSTFIWPLIKNDVLQHDSYLCHTYNGSIAFPSKRDINNAYVGMSGLPSSGNKLPACPIKCRPNEHLDWEYC